MSATVLFAERSGLLVRRGTSRCFYCGFRCDESTPASAHVKSSFTSRDTVSGIATLTILRDEKPYDALELSSQRLVAGLEQEARAAKIPVSIARCGSMFTIFFQAEPVHNLTDAKRSDTARFAKFFQGMLGRGIYLACSQFEAHFVSTGHSEAEINATLTAAGETFQALNS